MSDSPSTTSVESDVATYTEAQLTGMTINEIKALATELGYTITKTVKAEIIAEFLAQQNSDDATTD